MHTSEAKGLSLCTYPLWAQLLEQPGMAASAEFVASLNLLTSQAQLPVIGRLRFCRWRQRTSLERFLDFSVYMVCEDLECGHAVILKQNCYKLYFCKSRNNDMHAQCCLIFVQDLIIHFEFLLVHTCAIYSGVLVAEGTPSEAPYPYGKQKETHELIFLWLSWLAVLLAGRYARRWWRWWSPGM